MKGLYKLLFVISVFFSLAGCKREENLIKPDFEFVQQYTVAELQKAVDHLQLLSENLSDKEEAISQFIHARHSFKKAESIAGYINPESAHRVNGPALPVFKEDNGKVLPPVGLQAIEEHVYGEMDSAAMRYQINITIGFLNNLKKQCEDIPVTPKRFFVAAHQQLLSIVSLGITGFDTPVSFTGLEESVVSLGSFYHVYENAIGTLIKSKNDSLHQVFKVNIDNAIAYLKGNPDFDTFDRYTFIREYMNPITRTWVAIRQQSGLWEGSDSYAINFDAPTFFESNSFNLNYFTSPVNRNPTEKQISLGEMLFFEKKLSTEGILSCASCHQPKKAYTDGLVVSVGIDGQSLTRNAPTLLNAAFQKKFFWDGRSDNLEQQINVVFSNEDEFNNSAHAICDEILNDQKYKQLFEQAYGGTPNKNQIVRAISSYVGTLHSFNSKFDRNMRNEESSFSGQEIEGMNLFMGKALCATCHFVPLFNGTVPPHFKETEKEVLGVPETAENEGVDGDEGFYPIFNEAIHMNMFKTPTVRNVEFTAPFMHNGVYNTLDEVMNFYNVGGGEGMDFGVPNQTLPPDSLHLNEEEIQSIITFMKTLSDVPEYDSETL